MDNWLKALIAATCICVVGAIAYFIQSDRAEKAEAAQMADRLTKARICRDRVNQIKSGQLSGDDIPVISECALNGLVSGDDATSAMKARKARMGG